MFKKIIAAVLLLVFPQTTYSMPLLNEDDKVSKTIDIRIKAQNKAFEQKRFSQSYKLNLQLEKDLAFLIKKNPKIKVALYVDRALILKKLGKSSQALMMMRQLYEAKALELLDTGYNIDYYGYAVNFYTELLPATERVKANDILSKLADKVIATDVKHQTLYAMQYPATFVYKRSDSGELEHASNMCIKIFHWLSRFRIEDYRDWHRTIMTNGDFVVESAVRMGPHDKFLAYLSADVNDSCAAVDEQKGLLEDALKKRLESREQILKSDSTRFIKVVDFNLARLFAFMGKPTESLQYLKSSWQAYSKDGSIVSAQRDFCHDMAFYYDGKPERFIIGGKLITPKEVWQHLTSKMESPLQELGVNCTF
jgi:hypothetical protein